MNQNQIEILDRYTFHELKNLVTLSLADNKIKFLSGDQFTPLSSIQYLSIQNNLLQTPATGWFKATGLGQISYPYDMQHMKCNIGYAAYSTNLAVYQAYNFTLQQISGQRSTPKEINGTAIVQLFHFITF